jgi:hypothetical protein
MARVDHNSDFECIRECRNQVYAIKRQELIIFTNLIVVNKA